MRGHVRTSSHGGHHEPYSPVQNTKCKRWDTPDSSLHSCDPPFIRPSLITKWKKGKPSLYGVRSAWGNGHSRMVEPLSLGRRERVMEQMRAPCPSAPPQELPGLRTVQLRECGASALFSALAQQRGRIELSTAHVLPAPPGRRPSLSVGHDLVLAAINRAAWPQSQRAFAAWYQGTVLARLVPALPDEWRSQRCWAHRDLCEPEDCAPMHRELVRRMHARFPLGAPCLVYDTTTTSTFIHPFNRRPSLPQRGKHTQKRAELRPISLALVVEEARGLPRSSRCAEGHGTAGVALGASLQEMGGPCLPPTVSPRLTLGLDNGPGSRDNFKARTAAHFSSLAAIPAGWVRRLSQVPLQAYPPLARPDGRRLKGSGQPNTRLADLQGPLLVRCSPPCYRQQGRPLDLLQRQATQRLLHLRVAIQQAVARHRPRTEQAVKGASAPLGRHDRLKECLAPTLHRHPGRVQERRWQGDGRQKRASKPRDFGTTVLLTDRQEREPPRMVLASRSQAQAEAMVRISTSRRPGLGWPASHGTDRTRSVHALSGFLALWLLRLVLLRLPERNLAVGVDLLTERLRGLHEARVVYAHGAAQRVITARSPEQEALCAALDGGSLAAQWGNRVLHSSNPWENRGSPPHNALPP